MPTPDEVHEVRPRDNTQQESAVRFILPALLVLSLCAAVRPDDDAWKTYTSKEGKFSVLWPGEPKITQTKHPQTQTVKTNYKAQSPWGGIQLLMVDVADLPAAEVKKNGLEGTVKAVKDALTGSGLGATLVSEEKCVIGKAKHAGKDLVLHLPDETTFVRLRACLVGERLYTVTIVGKKSSTEDGTSKRLFESFTPMD
jgi:hypothetical protein